jgi:hypothetical protein
MQARTIVVGVEHRRRRFNRPSTASGQAVLAPCAISSAAYLRPGTRMESARPSISLPDCSRRSRQIRNACGKRSSAAAYSACPLPDLFVASTCMLQNVRSAIGPLSVRTLWRLHRGAWIASASGSSTATPALSGAFSAVLPHSALTGRRAQRIKLGVREIVFPAVVFRVQRASIRGRNVVRPRTGCRQ